MPCGHRRSRDVTVERRAFLKTAVVIGGATAVSACLDREPEPERGSPDELDRDGRQYAWNDYLEINDAGSAVPPRHHVLVTADYDGTDEPTEEERQQFETVLHTLERAYEWSNEGLMHVVGYSPNYFGIYGTGSPDGVDSPQPKPLADFEDPELDRDQIAIHLASDYANAVLSAEEAIFGELDEVNGVRLEADASEFLEKTGRRTGFIGEGLPADNQDVEGIPDSQPVHEDAPLYMGYHTLHATNQATEDDIEIQDGRFEGGTTMHVSKIRLNLDEWYDGLTEEERVQRMFTANTEPDDVGEVGEKGETTQSPAFLPPDLPGHADEYGVVGHGGKAAIGRRGEERRPTLLRRDFNTTDGNHAGVHFVSLQREISDFVKVREGMNGKIPSELTDSGEMDLTDHEDIGQRENNGILSFMQVERRANYLIPPLEQRSLPES